MQVSFIAAPLCLLTALAMQDLAELVLFYDSILTFLSTSLCLWFHKVMWENLIQTQMMVVVVGASSTQAIMGVMLADPHCHKCFVYVIDYIDTV